MPLSQITDKKMRVGTVIRSGRPEAPIYYAVSAVEPAPERFGSPARARWKVSFRAATDEEKTLFDVMQT